MDWGEYLEKLHSSLTLFRFGDRNSIYIEADRHYYPSPHSNSVASFLDSKLYSQYLVLVRVADIALSFLRLLKSHNQKRN